MMKFIPRFARMLSIALAVVPGNMGRPSLGAARDRRH